MQYFTSLRWYVWVQKHRYSYAVQKMEAIWRRRISENLGVKLRYGERLQRSAHSFVGMPCQYAKPIPRKIWIYWAQGYEAAPPLVKECVRSWREKNPDWEVMVLSNETVPKYVTLDAVLLEKQRLMTVQAYSDALRLALLNTRGGVWVDATTFCSQPLNGWLHSLTQADFFCFSNCGWKRPVASWFIASQPSSLLSTLWYRNIVKYWTFTEEAHQYFWVHQLFSDLIQNNKDARHYYALMPKIDASASHAVQRYAENPDVSYLEDLECSIRNNCIPISKLSNWEVGSREEKIARAVLNID